MVKTISTERIPPADRFATGIKDLDWLYGCSDLGYYQWGIPLKSISLIEGARGGGKTKLAVEILKSITLTYMPVLYFQIESDLGDFESKVQRGTAFNREKFYISNTSDLSGQERELNEIRPRIIVVDSVQQVDAFKSGSAKSTNELIRVYRNYVEKNYAHIILLSQLNGDGTPAGGTKLPHLADIEFTLKKECGFVVFRVGEKHRYGPTGKQYFSVWQHRDSFIECQSEHCLEDEFWCRTHNMPVKVPFAALAEDRIRREQEAAKQPSVIGNALKYAVKSTAEDVIFFGGLVTGIIQGANRKR